MSGVRLVPAADGDRPLLRRLWQLYLDDLSVYESAAPGPDGLFDPGPYFDLYWSESDRHPLLIEVDGRVAGFALVRRLPDGTHQMAEFFVLRGERRRGVGREAALAVFERYPGRWEVAQMRANAPARAFWRAVVAECSGGRFEEGPTDSPVAGVRQVFTTSAAAAGSGIDVPTEFARATVAREGPAGEEWIAWLPARIESLCRRWRLRPVGDPMHGYVALVMPVVRDGVPLALKVSWVDESSRHEATALRIWDGRGAVRVVEEDAGAGALLLEWLDPDHSLMVLPSLEAAAVAGGLLRRLWVPGPSRLRRVHDAVTEARATLRERWQASGCPCPQRWVAWAEAGPVEHGGAGPSERIVNQDLHYENVLAGEREPWLVIDPKPLLGPPEFGVAPLLWNRASDLVAPYALDRRLRVIADAGQLDGTRVRDWSRWRLIEAGIRATEEADLEFASRAFRLAGWLDADGR